MRDTFRRRAALHAWITLRRVYQRRSMLRIHLNSGRRVA